MSRKTIKGALPKVRMASSYLKRDAQRLYDLAQRAERQNHDLKTLVNIEAPELAKYVHRNVIDISELLDGPVHLVPNQLFYSEPPGGSPKGTSKVLALMSDANGALVRLTEVDDSQDHRGGENRVKYLRRFVLPPRALLANYCLLYGAEALDRLRQDLEATLAPSSGASTKGSQLFHSLLLCRFPKECLRPPRPIPSTSQNLGRLEAEDVRPLDVQEESYRQWYERQGPGKQITAYVAWRSRAVMVVLSKRAAKEAKVWIFPPTIKGEPGTVSYIAAAYGEAESGLFNRVGDQQQLPQGRYRIRVEPDFLEPSWSEQIRRQGYYDVWAELSFVRNTGSMDFDLVRADPITVGEAVVQLSPSQYSHHILAGRRYVDGLGGEEEDSPSQDKAAQGRKAFVQRIGVATDLAKLGLGLNDQGNNHQRLLMLTSAVNDKLSRQGGDGLRSDWASASLQLTLDVHGAWSAWGELRNESLKMVGRALGGMEGGQYLGGARRSIESVIGSLKVAGVLGSTEDITKGLSRQEVGRKVYTDLLFPEPAPGTPLNRFFSAKSLESLGKFLSAVELGLSVVAFLQSTQSYLEAGAQLEVHRSDLEVELDKQAQSLGRGEGACLGRSQLATLDMHLQRTLAAVIEEDGAVVAAGETLLMAALGAVALLPNPAQPIAGLILAVSGFSSAGKAVVASAQGTLDALILQSYWAGVRDNKKLSKGVHDRASANLDLLKDAMLQLGSGTQGEKGDGHPERELEVQLRSRTQALLGLQALILRAVLSCAEEHGWTGSLMEQLEDIADYVEEKAILLWHVIQDIPYDADKQKEEALLEARKKSNARRQQVADKLEKYKVQEYVQQFILSDEWTLNTAWDNHIPLDTIWHHYLSVNGATWTENDSIDECEVEEGIDSDSATDVMALGPITMNLEADPILGPEQEALEQDAERLHNHGVCFSVYDLPGFLGEGDLKIPSLTHLYYLIEQMRGNLNSTRKVQFQKSAPIHRLDMDATSLGMTLDVTHYDLDDDVIDYTCTYFQELAPNQKVMPSQQGEAPWLTLEERQNSHSKTDEVADSVQGQPRLSVFNPLKVVIVMAAEVERPLPLELTLVRTDWLNISGPQYKLLTYRLRDKDFVDEDERKRFSGRMGVVFKPFFFLGPMRIPGTRPMVQSWTWSSTIMEGVEGARNANTLEERRKAVNDAWGDAVEMSYGMQVQVSNNSKTQKWISVPGGSLGNEYKISLSKARIEDLNLFTPAFLRGRTVNYPYERLFEGPKHLQVLLRVGGEGAKYFGACQSLKGIAQAEAERLGFNPWVSNPSSNTMKLWEFDWSAQVDFMVIFAVKKLERGHYPENAYRDWRKIPARLHLNEHEIEGMLSTDGPTYSTVLTYLGSVNCEFKVNPDIPQEMLPHISALKQTSRSVPEGLAPALELLGQGEDIRRDMLFASPYWNKLQAQFKNAFGDSAKSSGLDGKDYIPVAKAFYEKDAGGEWQVYAAHVRPYYTSFAGNKVEGLKPFGAYELLAMMTESDLDFGFSVSSAGASGLHKQSVPVEYRIATPKELLAKASPWVDGENVSEDDMERWLGLDAARTSRPAQF